MLSDNKVIEIFYMADDFCKFFNETVPFHHTPAKQRQTIIEVLEGRQNSVAPTAL